MLRVPPSIFKGERLDSLTWTDDSLRKEQERYSRLEYGPESQTFVSGTIVECELGRVVPRAEGHGRLLLNREDSHGPCLTFDTELPPLNCVSATKYLLSHDRTS